MIKVVISIFFVFNSLFFHNLEAFSLYQSLCDQEVKRNLLLVPKKFKTNLGYVLAIKTDLKNMTQQVVYRSGGYPATTFLGVQVVKDWKYSNQCSGDKPCYIFYHRFNDWEGMPVNVSIIIEKDWQGYRLWTSCGPSGGL